MVTDDTSACDKPVLYGPPSASLQGWSTQEVVVDGDDDDADDCNDSAADVYHDQRQARPCPSPKMMVVDHECVEVQHKILLCMRTASAEVFDDSRSGWLEEGNSLTKKLMVRMKSVLMMMIKRIMMMTPKRMQLSGE